MSANALKVLPLESEMQIVPAALHMALPLLLLLFT